MGSEDSIKQIPNQLNSVDVIDQFEIAQPNLLDTVTAPPQFPTDDVNPTHSDELPIEYLTQSINESLVSSNFEPPSAQMDPVVSDFELPTRAVEENTRALLSSAKDIFFRDLTRSAKSPEDFDSLMRRKYGDNYNKEAAEAIRLKILAKDDSWLPKTELLSSTTLQGHNRAVDPASGVIISIRIFRS
jgi:hypothetical protein